MERALKEITVAGKSVTVREITVGEARAWWREMEERAQKGEMDVVADMLFETAPLSLIHLMTGLAPEDTDAMTPSALRRVMDAAKEMNPDFFALRRRLMAAAGGAPEED